MAKQSMINREVKRKKVANRDTKKRDALKATIINEELTFEEKFDAMLALQKLPRNGSVCRQRRRCFITGRPRGNYRKFGLARSKLRELIMRGDVPGVTKSSW